MRRARTKVARYVLVAFSFDTSLSQTKHPVSKEAPLKRSGKGARRVRSLAPRSCSSFLSAVSTVRRGGP